MRKGEKPIPGSCPLRSSECITAHTHIQTRIHVCAHMKIMIINNLKKFQPQFSEVVFIFNISIDYETEA